MVEELYIYIIINSINTEFYNFVESVPQNACGTTQQTRDRSGYEQLPGTDDQIQPTTQSPAQSAAGLQAMTSSTPSTSKSAASAPVKQNEGGATRESHHNARHAEESHNQYLIMKILPYVEVTIFGAVSIWLFVIQAITHRTCDYAINNTLTNRTSYNSSMIHLLEDAKNQYDVLFPCNILEIIFVGLQVSSVIEVSITSQ